MIMRIGWVTGSAYEWTATLAGAATAGIPPRMFWRSRLAELDALTLADKRS